jgi:hypothetical protein
MLFRRFEELKSAGTEIQLHPAWVWTPQGVYDTHRPDCFTTIRFSSGYRIFFMARGVKVVDTDR